jgi:hypothetical protein
MNSTSVSASSILYDNRKSTKYPPPPASTGSSIQCEGRASSEVVVCYIDYISELLPASDVSSGGVTYDEEVVTIQPTQGCLNFFQFRE